MNRAIASLTAFVYLVASMNLNFARAQSDVATENDVSVPSDFLSQLWAFIFYFVLLPGIPIYLYVLMRRSGAMKQGHYLQRAEKHMELAETHMTVVEKQNARIIELLESRAGSEDVRNR